MNHCNCKCSSILSLEKKARQRCSRPDLRRPQLNIMYEIMYVCMYVCIMYKCMYVRVMYASMHLCMYEGMYSKMIFVPHGFAPLQKFLRAPMALKNFLS